MPQPHRSRLELETLEDRILLSGSELLWPGPMQWSTTLQFGDFNGDRLREPLARSATSGWWLGPANDHSYSIPLIAFGRDPRAFVADFNGDGRDDIASLSTVGVWRVSLNMARQRTATIWCQWSGASAWKSLQVGDFDGDGRADIAGQNRSGQWWVARSTGRMFDTRLWGSWSPNFVAASIEVGDVNGDRRDDLIAFDRAGRWWVGVSTFKGFVTTQWARTGMATGWRSLHVGDFNADGFDDVAGFRNDGTWWVGTSTRFAFRLGRWTQWPDSGNWSRVAVADFDGDRRADIAGFNLLGEWQVAHAGSGRFLERQDWDDWDDASQWLFVAVGDLDGDRRADLQGYHVSGKLKRPASLQHANTLAASNVADLEHPVEVRPWSSEANPWQADSYWQTATALDRDGDGRDELFGFADGESWWGAPNNALLFQYANWQTDPNWDRVFTGDVNRDGRQEAIAFHRNGGWSIVGASGNQAVPRLGAVWLDASRWRDLFVGDFNGDRRTDIAGVAHDGGVWVGLSNGSTFRTAKWAQWSPGASWRSLFVGDFNGDCRADLIGAHNDGSFWVGTSNGVRFRAAKLPLWLPGAPWARVLVGDFNGDRRVDIAGVGVDGAWWVASNKASGLAFTQWLGWTGSSHIQTLRTGDFNGDGRTDVLAMTGQGEWWVVLAASRGFLLQRWLHAGTTFDGATARVGDFNGDGRDDVVLFGPDGGKAFWQAFSTGRAFRVATEITSEQVPFRAGAPWHPTNARAPINAIPVSLLRRLVFNRAATLVPFEQHFLGTLRGWSREADALNLDDNAQIAFLRGKLDAFFPQVRSAIAQRYPGLTDPQYRLLMTMNLVHGHFDYETRCYVDTDLRGLLPMTSGDCSEFASLTAALCKIQGFEARIVSWVSSYTSPTGGVIVGVHAVAYVNGMLLDALANIGIQVNLDAIRHVPPAQRLQRLLDQGLVYGFYDWFAKPEVRQVHLARGYDAAVIPLYYFYYFEGIGQGKSSLTMIAL